MKTTLYYSTMITAYIATCKGNSFMYDFDSGTNLEECKCWATNAFDNYLEIPAAMISKITFIDHNTGEVLMECAHDDYEEEFNSDWDYNEDEGFDPYEGGYTYDC